MAYNEAEVQIDAALHRVAQELGLGAIKAMSDHAETDWMNNKRGPRAAFYRARLEQLEGWLWYNERQYLHSEAEGAGQ